MEGGAVRVRADRLISILLLLQANKRMTTSELADHLGVSERTIHRDMVALSSAGFPVYADRGKHGGWGLLEDYQTNVTKLNQSEFPVLFLPVPTKLLQDLGMEKDAQLAQLKLLDILPKKLRTDAENISQRIYLDTAGWHAASEETTFLSSLLKAVWEKRQAVIHYLRGDGQTRERTVNPLGLVAKGSVWYLVALVDEEIRTYRVNRIKEVKITQESFVRPEFFHLAEFWERSSRDFLERLPKYPVVVRAHPDLREKLNYLGRYPMIHVLRESDEQGWMELSLTFQIETEACAYIMGFGNRMEVLQPPELREKVSKMAQDIVALYAERDNRR
jgi:predicted DNA-binding transcriptional regulator YafY